METERVHMNWPLEFKQKLKQVAESNDRDLTQ